MGPNVYDIFAYFTAISLTMFLNLIAQKINDPFAKSILVQGAITYAIFEHLRDNMKKIKDNYKSLYNRDENK